ncbi:preprotein translocase subunit SecD/SecF [Devosia limi DSM 17137]|uniref:Multifunctional fusion protein n=1 Tax=Devosia limi DSM 17137 TaxID=1121477 RepID=A0A0F5LN02_9HYPH|nr:protein translocase subunit SecD [Devosia limi]KKB83751.1 preprotein translocase subunit SecD/SecF [Devosia limi DSM 17137]SHE71579.1 SecD/SecF fusion protein [Devosia limi DSM 17137]
MQFSPLRTAIIAFVALLGVLFAVPSFLPQNVREAWPSFLPQQTIVLGLDLQGGSHLLLQVNEDGIVTERLQSLRRDVRNLLANQNGIGNLITTDAENATITIELTDPTQKEAARTAIQTLQTTVSNSMFAVGGVNELSFGETPDGKLTITLTPEGITERMSALVAQSIEVIRKRVDELGTTEPSIQRQGTSRVLVQVPGFGDSERLKDIISRTARLTFHMVYPGMSAAQAEAQGLPAGTMILPSQDGGKELIYEDIALGGESLVDAQPSFDSQRNMPVVSFRFDTRGAVTFGQITSANVGQRFAIVLDNQVITAPQIQQPITGGTGQISGSFTTQTANDLAVLLRAGALPASLDVIEERTVDASLGADSIQHGLTAGIVASVLVVSFMVIAYGLFGVFANISLVLNIVLIFGALSMLGATLTLPGIAGIVLTIGMAVDANVLIYERIREEQKAGKTPLQAINAGFDRAWGTIIDSHLTQLIAAVVLYFLGSGPVQGFAVTLGLGILTSLFTSYTVTLYFVGMWYRWRRPKTLKIQHFRFIPDGTKIPFMKISRYVIAFSIIMSVLSIGSAVFRGFNLGIDFVGGTAIVIQHEDGPADVGKVRELLDGLNLGEVQVQGFGTPEDVLVRVQAQEGGQDADQVAVAKVREALATENYTVRSTEAVSGTVSGELAWKGAIAVIISLVAILIYIWFRFEWQFALAAVTTTTHDVIMTIGLFSITGLEFNLTSIAAVLTLVGLSLNETVVVSDRIRENLRKHRKMPLPDLIDLSINQTIVRTTITQFTVFLALIPLVLFGGEVIRSFTIAMTFGCLVGMYSSIIVNGPILINFGLKSKADEPKDARPKSADGASV